MKFLKTGLSLALLGAGLAAVPGAAASAAPPSVAPANRPDGDQRLVQQMRQDASGGVRVSRQGGTGAVSFARATGRDADLLPSQAAGDAREAGAKASAYLDDYGAVFGAGDGELRRNGVTADDYGWTVDYTQVYRGVPVFGSRVRAHVDTDGDLTAVAGYAAPDISLDVTPSLSRDEASRRAVQMASATGSPGVAAASTTLEVYRTGSTRGIDGTNELAWVVEATNQRDVRDMVILDADTGKTLNRWSMMANAEPGDGPDRELYEADPEGNGYPDAQLVWEEGDPLPDGLDADQLSEVYTTGETYWFYKNSFGRDSYDDQGSTMITVNNDPTISCPNANWNGVTTNYCSGVSSDDTVAHEWSHAYTEYTSGLVYQWQPGAMNEAYSDIWGEVVDDLNDRYNGPDADPDNPNDTDALPRTDGHCSKYTRGPIQTTITAPAGVAGPCESAAAAFGPVIDTTGVDADVVVGTDVADDGDNGDGTTTDGCSELTNAGDVAGSWVYVDRGACTFQQKVDNAVAADADGIVVGDNREEPPFSISATAPGDFYGIMVSQAAGTDIKSVGEVSIHTEDATTEPLDDSSRWLSGESDTAFGGAIRDMWNPTCYGDPGKVSDEEYLCGEHADENDDSGGVHTNSGVVNHTFALLVDGGSFNGQDVTGLGIDKVGHLFWRTQTTYLGPVSEFPDLADGLEASCSDLVGQDITKLTLGDGVGGSADDAGLAEPITEADCAEVTKAIAAVELRQDPEQCDFGPLLGKDAPSACGRGHRTQVSYREGFEDGLKGWKKNFVLTELPDYGYAGNLHRPWEATSDVPGDHGGTVAYGPAPDGVGDCLGAGNDFSSSDAITSPVVRVPRGLAPRMQFDHYVATEYGWDGGTVRVSVNGGKFKTVPVDAYVYNAPGTTLYSFDDDFSTNPLEGQPGFTGTDGGHPYGSWGTSVIDLRKVAKPGQKLQVRFVVGRDGCGGLDGWYVDDVLVTACRAKTRVAANGRSGRHAAVAVKVARAGSKGASPSGKVVVKKGKRTVGKTYVRKGQRKLVHLHGLGRGRHRLVVRYTGTARFAPSAHRVTVRVRR